MKPLLKIQTIPIKIEAQSKRASLQYDTQQPTVNVTRNKGRANIRTTPTRLNIDQTAARNNSGLRTNSRIISDAAQAGKSAAMEATRNFAEDGNRILDSHGKGNPIAEIAAEKAMRMPDSGVPPFGQRQGPDITVEHGSISFDYQMDTLTFDWNINTRPQLEYIPASIEFSVTQYPQLVIEYVGEPIYVPASANPNYVPPPGIDETA